MTQDCSVCILFEESVFIFQFLNDEIHNYVKQSIIENFIIEKLKNKHTFLKKHTNWAKLSSLVLTEWEKKKLDISHQWHTIFDFSMNQSLLQQTSKQGNMQEQKMAKNIKFCESSLIQYCKPIHGRLYRDVHGLSWPNYNEVSSISFLF